MGYNGSGIDVAVFDTGLNYGHPDFDTVVQRTVWTEEDSADVCSLV